MTSEKIFKRENYVFLLTPLTILIGEQMGRSSTPSLFTLINGWSVPVSLCFGPKFGFRRNEVSSTNDMIWCDQSPTSPIL